jgi:hypothetical protein
MVARFPRLVMTELILRFLVFFLIITNCEWLIQVVSLVLIDMVDAIWVIPFSHLFRSAFVVGICLATRLSVLVDHT